MLNALFLRIKESLFPKKSDVSRAPASKTGNHGEAIAARFLKKTGFSILGSNIRAFEQMELDIIAKKDNSIHFVEVKTRTSEKYGRPLDSVNGKKRLHLRKAATAWLKRHNKLNSLYQFDVVEVILIENEAPEIRHIQNIDMSKTIAPFQKT